MKKLTHKEFVERVIKVHGDEYEVIGEYTLSTVPVEIRHTVCGKTWKPTPNTFLQGRRNCPHCKNERARLRFSKTHEVFVAEVEKAGGGEYRVIGTYVNNRTKIKIQHVPCKHCWEILPNNFLKPNGNRCPRCRSKMSKAAKRIQAVLDEIGVKYELEKTFAKCKLKELLPFDFYLPDYSMLIEYDGELHDRPWQIKDRKRVEQNLLLTQLRDKTKDEFAKANGFTLIRIRHDQDLEGDLTCLREYLMDEGSTTSRKA